MARLNFSLNVLFIVTDLNPCLNVHCPRFGVCKTYSAHDARCECLEQCPSYQDPVCTANGTTYDNKCWHALNYCRGLENNLVYHPGSCEGKGYFYLSSAVKMQARGFIAITKRTEIDNPYVTVFLCRNGRDLHTKRRRFLHSFSNVIV